MRTRHWLAGLMGGYLALASVGTANAQPPGMPTNGNPDQRGMEMLPAPYNTTYGPAQPNPGGMNSPGYPPGANPWPNVSPYAGPPVENTAYEDGFWFRNIKTGGRRYYGSVDAVYGKSSKGSNALIGSPNVNPLTQDSIAGRSAGFQGLTTTGAIFGLTLFDQTPPGLGPHRLITVTAAGGGGGGGGAGGATGTPNIFPSYDTGILTDTLTGSGVRGTWGWWNADDTGFVVSGFMQSRGSANFSLNDPSLVIDPNSQNYNPLLHLHAWFGLPLAGADTDGTTLTAGTTTATLFPSGTEVINDGAVVPYDMGVFVSFQSRIAGANTDWYFNPIYDSKSIKVRPLAGVKYVRLQEAFQFDGFDSGLGYTVNNPQSAGAGGGGGGTGTATTTSGAYTPQAFQVGFSVPAVIHSHLLSTVTSNMTGSEVGFRVDMGGNKFQVWTQTKAGALVNVAQRQLSGYNIGNNFNIITPNTVPAMPNDQAATAFGVSSYSASLVPMFEQQFNFKVPVFNLIPYLNKMEIFERAQLTGGYTFLFLGDVLRPNNTINWNQTVLQPTFNSAGAQTGTHVSVAPSLNEQKSNFYNSMFNIGVEWTY